MHRIVSLVAAEPGWRALYRGEFADDEEFARVVAWALVEGEDGTQSVIGMVVDSTDPTRIVSASDAVSPAAPDFERYGFKRA